MTKQLRIIGTDVCQPCSISGHDGDACRANKLDDGGVFCITCSSVSTPISENARAIYQMPMSVKLVVAALLRRDVSQPEPDPQYEPLTATYAQYGPDELTPERASAACAQGNADVVLGQGRIVFATDALASLDVRFQYQEVKNFARNAFDPKAITADDEMFLEHLANRSCPPALVAATRKLLEIGFVVLHADLDSSMRRVVFCHTLGAELNRRNPRGVFAEVKLVV
jgi:hypothetical protein